VSVSGRDVLVGCGVSVGVTGVLLGLPNNVAVGVDDGGFAGVNVGVSVQVGDTVGVFVVGISVCVGVMVGIGGMDVGVGKHSASDGDGESDTHHIIYKSIAAATPPKTRCAISLIYDGTKSARFTATTPRRKIKTATNTSDNVNLCLTKQLIFCARRSSINPMRTNPNKNHTNDRG